MSIRVRLLSKFARSGASSRLRMLQYLPMLERLGVSVEHHPLLPDEYVEALFAGRLSASRLLAARGYIGRVGELWRRDPGDVDWVEGEALPFLPRVWERMLMRGRCSFIVEYDDALFHRYGLSRNPAVRALLGSKIDAVMREATCVIAGNRYLAERAKSVGAVRVEVIPTVVDVTRYTPVLHAERQKLVIGWIGSPVTQHYLYPLRASLREVCRRYDAVLRLVGTSADVAKHLQGVPIECVAWTESGEAGLLADVDIGIMPLVDGPWERGKCGYKLVQYMASGLPVVASPVGVNTDLVRPNVNGLLPADWDDWVGALSALLDSAALRSRLGAAGRQRVEAELCIQVQAPRLASIMCGLVDT